MTTANQNQAVEAWLPIPGYEGSYLVSDFGRVMSVERWVIGGRGKRQNVPEKVLKPAIDSYGYAVVTLRCNTGSSRLLKVHRLVLLAFRGESNLMGCHRDGDPTNNYLGNLRYGTALDNSGDRALHGRTAKQVGEANGLAKLTVKTVLEIRRYLQESWSHRKIAELYGVCPESIRRIAVGKTWSHV